MKIFEHYKNFEYEECETMKEMILGFDNRNLVDNSFRLIGYGMI